MSEQHKEFLRQYGIKRETETISYHFISLETAILHMKGFVPSAKNQPTWSVLTGRYFPFLWDGSNVDLAIDFDPAGKGRIVLMNKKEQHPLRLAYDTFEAFLDDAIRANETNQLLTCITNPGEVLDATNIDAPKHHIDASSEPDDEDGLLLIRHSFENDREWQALNTALETMKKRFSSPLRIISDRKFAGANFDSLQSNLGSTVVPSVVFIADKLTFESSERLILVVNLRDVHRKFRTALSVLPEIENNLSTANMGFEEFEASVDADGVFRKFVV